MADTMERVVMDPEIYKQIGELTGRFNTLEKNMERQFDDLKQAIREQNNVPLSVFKEYTKESRAITDDLSTRVDAIEDMLRVKEATITGKVALFLDNALVKIIGTSLIGLILVAIYINYQTQIRLTNDRIDSVVEGKTDSHGN